MHKFQVLQLSALLLLPLLVNVAQGAEPASPDAAQIDSIFHPLITPGSPGMSVLVIENGKTVFRNSYGLSSLPDGPPNQAVTDFRLASVTKQFTAMCILLLVHDGKLTLDENLTSVFPNFPKYGAKITIRQLLTHTSGLKDYEDLYQAQFPPGTPEEKIPQIKDAGVLKILEEQSTTDFPPGSRWRYSNSGYAVLAMIVEKVSSQPFGDFLRKRIFTPLGMTNTLAYEAGKNQVPHRALGYRRSGDTWIAADQSSTSAVLGDGGIYSNVDDLATWDRALREHTLLSEAEMKPALTPVVVPGGAKDDQGKSVEYGFGWFLDSYNGRKRMHHNGETSGFLNTIQRFPDDGLTIIVLCNRTDVLPESLALKIADLYQRSTPSQR